MPKLIELTESLARASGLDAGNSSMRKAGRKAWNEDDREVAARETNRLMYLIASPAIQAAMRKDRLV